MGSVPAGFPCVPPATGESRSGLLVLYLFWPSKGSGGAGAVGLGSCPGCHISFSNQVPQPPEFGARGPA